MKFKEISITLCQQGGIGALPRLIKIDKWYAISDSRESRPSQFFWDNTENDKYHSQRWALRKFKELPQITQKEVEERMKAIIQGSGSDRRQSNDTRLKPGEEHD